MSVCDLHSPSKILPLVRCKILFFQFLPQVHIAWVILVFSPNLAWESGKVTLDTKELQSNTVFIITNVETIFPEDSEKIVEPYMGLRML